MKAFNREHFSEPIAIKATSRKKCVSSLTFRSKDVTYSGSTSPHPQTALLKEVHPNFVFQQQLMSEFLRIWLPRSSRAIQHQKTDEEANWLMMLPELPSLTKALETSILAVCTAKLGHFYNSHVLIIESNKLYGRGLWELQKALWDPKLMYKDETLAACMSLSLYEMLECPAQSRYGWLSHSGGCARLIQLRGPEAHCTPLGHHLFRTCRLATVCTSSSMNNL